MVRPDGQNKKIVMVTEVYVAVFPVPVNEDLMAEVILAGYRKDPYRPQMSQVRATVEVHESAVADLVELCDEILETQQEIPSYRLLKFDEEGVHILDPEHYRSARPLSDYSSGNTHRGYC